MGFAVDQLTHCLQTATLAERAGADKQVVVASLFHDVGKAISVPNHPRIAAEILRPYVRDEVYKMILVHQDFQGKHYYHHFGGDPAAREKHRGTLSAEEFALAERFADEWDQLAFDPDYDTLPLEHFETAVRRGLRALPHMLWELASHVARRRCDQEPPPAPPPPPPPPPAPPPEKPLPPEPAGVDCNVPTLVVAKPLTESLNAITLNGRDDWYHDVSGCSARPSNVFAHLSTTPKTIAYGRYSENRCCCSANFARSRSDSAMKRRKPSTRRISPVPFGVRLGIRCEHACSTSAGEDERDAGEAVARPLREHEREAGGHDERTDRDAVPHGADPCRAGA